MADWLAILRSNAVAWAERRDREDESIQPTECEWLEVGWSTKLDLSQDWFSHNLPSWLGLLGSRGWLRTCECCLPQRRAARRSMQPLRVLEVGTWEGNSACWLASHVACQEEDELVCVDSFAGSAEHLKCEVYAKDLKDLEARCRRNLARAAAAEGGAGRVRLLKDLSHSALSSLQVSLEAEEEQAFDLIYIDGSHEWEHVLEDARLAWPLLRAGHDGRNAGGLLIFDDYLWHGASCPHFAPHPVLVGALVGACGGEKAVEERNENCRCPGRAIDAFVQALQGSVRVVSVNYQVALEKL